jgi:hypothetical protein
MNNKNYTYRKLKLTDLESNKYYTFYKKDNTKFKAILDSIINITLIVRNYESDNEKDLTSLRSISSELISYAESEEFKIKINNYLTT